MSRQSKAANLCGAPVQDVKQHALALLHTHRFTMTQHAAIDGEVTIANLVTVGHTLCERGFHGRLASRFEFFHLGGRQEILGHVAALTERWFKFFEYEKDFAIVISGVVLRFDIDRTNLARILPGVKVGPGAVMRVIEAQSQRLRSEGDSAHSMS